MNRTAFVCWSAMVVFVWSMALECSVSAATRLAIVPLRVQTAPLADLLSVEMSRQPGVSVVERSELNRVMAEQALMLEQRRNYAQLGRLLSAQGVILLDERTADGTNSALRVRVVSAHSSIVVFDETTISAPKAMPQLSAVLAARLQMVIPKLMLNPSNAVPVSITSLRSSTATREALEAEQELTTLLHASLVQEPNVIILDRTSLEALETERNLNPENEAFWKSAFVLEGVIDPETVSLRTRAIDVRLAAPGKPAVRVRVEGEKTNHVGLIQALLRQVLPQIGVNPSTPAWDSRIEASLFLKEAEWARTAGLWRQMVSASDAAWALGNRSNYIAQMRVSARAGEAMSLRGPASWEPPDKDGTRNPRPDVLPVLTGALELYLSLFPMFATETNDALHAWGSVGMDLLVVTARVLDRFQPPALAEKNATELRNVRALGRDISKVLEETRGLGLTGWRRGGHVSAPVEYRYRTGGTLAAIYIETAGRLVETREEALAMWKKALDPAVYGDVRNQLITAGAALDPFPTPNRNSIFEFINAMTESTNAVIRCDGFHLLMKVSTEPSTVLAAAASYLRANQEVNNQFPRPKELGPIEQFTPAQVLSAVAKRRINWTAGDRQQMDQLIASAPSQFFVFTADYGYLTWSNALYEISTNGTLSPFGARPPALRRDQVDQLLAGFENVKGRDTKFVAWAISELRQQRDALGVPPITPVRAATPAAPLTTPAPSPESDELAVFRVWRLQDQKPPTGFDWNIFGLESWHFQSGRLWAEAGVWKQRGAGKSMLISVRLADMATELFEFPFTNVDGRGPLLVHANMIYRFVSGGVWARDPAGKWSRFNLPMTYALDAVSWNQHIIIATGDSILAYDPATKDVHLLASNRRNPPGSALDRSSFWALLNRSTGGASLAAWPDGTLNAAIGGTAVWAYNPSKKDWPLRLSVTNCDDFLDLQREGVLYRQSGQCGPKMLAGMRSGSSNLQYYTWAPTSPSRAAKHDVFTPPLWSYPTNAMPQDRVAHFSGSNLWVFPQTRLINPYMHDPATRDRSPWLNREILVFDPTLTEALELRPRFTGAAAEPGKTFQQLLFDPVAIQYVSTPEGLAMMMPKEGVLFWVPAGDIHAAIAAVRSRQKPVSRFAASLNARFDTNHDGWLSDAESSPMRRDATWRKDYNIQLDAAISRNIAQHRAEWEKAFGAADKNRDSKLSLAELESASKQNEPLYASRLLGVNGNLMQLFRPFDLNNDLALDKPEFLTFMGDPRLPAEVARLPVSVIRFGLQPETVDADDNGVLDPAERANANRMKRGAQRR